MKFLDGAWPKNQSIRFFGGELDHNPDAGIFKVFFITFAAA